MLTLSEFLNCVRSLYNINANKLPELTHQQWCEFRDNPPRYFINTDYAQQRAIVREINARQSERKITDNDGKFGGWDPDREFDQAKAYVLGKGPAKDLPVAK